MKHQWRGFAAGLMSSLVLFGGVGTALATVGQKTLTADYSDIKVTLDGQPVTLVDVNGDAVEPFAVDGTTYLPIRAISSALGLHVEWDADTSTVVLFTETSAPDETVYVSQYSRTIHSVSNCSGMKNYLEMTLNEALSFGYEYCSNCW